LFDLGVNSSFHVLHCFYKQDEALPGLSSIRELDVFKP
jgi:hypothetical protein